MMSLDDAYELISNRDKERSFVITDPIESDNHIVFVNEAFLQLTGYTRDEVLGRNCNFLQGPDTSQNVVDQIRNALKAEEQINIDILNYKKDGNPFWNHLHIKPIYSKSGTLDNFVGVQHPI